MLAIERGEDDYFYLGGCVFIRNDTVIIEENLLHTEFFDELQGEGFDADSDGLFDLQHLRITHWFASKQNRIDVPYFKLDKLEGSQSLGKDGFLKGVFLARLKQAVSDPDPQQLNIVSLPGEAELKIRSYSLSGRIIAQRNGKWVRLGLEERYYGYYQEPLVYNPRGDQSLRSQALDRLNIEEGQDYALRFIQGTSRYPDFGAIGAPVYTSDDDGAELVGLAYSYPWQCCVNDLGIAVTVVKKLAPLNQWVTSTLEAWDGGGTDGSDDASGSDAMDSKTSTDPNEQGDDSVDTQERALDDGGTNDELGRQGGFASGCSVSTEQATESPFGALAIILLIVSLRHLRIPSSRRTVR